MRWRAVTLDAAGTLIGPREPVGATYVRLAARHGIVADPAAVDARFRAAFAAAPPLAFPGVPDAELDAHERAWWRALVAAALGPDADGATLDAAFADCWTHYARGTAWTLYPDVPDALAALRRRGLRLAVVSNADGRLTAVLDDLGIAAAVDAVVLSGRAGAAKPDPAIFRAALVAIGVAAGDAVHVGDGARDDVAGARAAGLGAVLVDRDWRRPPLPAGVPALPSLAALPALLDDLR